MLQWALAGTWEPVLTDTECQMEYQGHENLAGTTAMCSLWLRGKNHWLPSENCSFLLFQTLMQTLSRKTGLPAATAQQKRSPCGHRAVCEPQQFSDCRLGLLQNAVWTSCQGIHQHAAETSEVSSRQHDTDQFIISAVSGRQSDPLLCFNETWPEINDWQAHNCVDRFLRDVRITYFIPCLIQAYNT